jgi:hypothetical protein
MRHVRDPQFDRRVSELEAHSRKYPRLSGPALQQQQQAYLERKYGTAKENEDMEEDDRMLSTPRARHPQPQPQQQIQPEDEHNDDDEDEETTPMQTNQRAASPTQMLLSSPTYNLKSNPNPAITAKSGSFDDDRPHPRERGGVAGTETVETSPSSSQRAEGDGDAVDGLLKLMGTSANAGAGTI